MRKSSGKAMKEAGFEIREENVMGEWESIVAAGYKWVSSE